MRSLSSQRATFLDYLDMVSFFRDLGGELFKIRNWYFKFNTSIHCELFTLKQFMMSDRKPTFAIFLLPKLPIVTNMDTIDISIKHQIGKSMVLHKHRHWKVSYATCNLNRFVRKTASYQGSNMLFLSEVCPSSNKPRDNKSSFELESLKLENRLSHYRYQLSNSDRWYIARDWIFFQIHFQLYRGQFSRFQSIHKHSVLQLKFKDELWEFLFGPYYMVLTNAIIIMIMKFFFHFKKFQDVVDR